MSPRPRSRASSIASGSLIVTGRDDGVRHFWASYIGSHVEPDGDVRGFSSFESHMTAEAKRMVWKQAEDFAAWATRQARDVALELHDFVKAAKLAVQGQEPVEEAPAERPPQQPTEPEQLGFEP